MFRRITAAIALTIFVASAADAADFSHFLRDEAHRRLYLLYLYCRGEPLPDVEQNDEDRKDRDIDIKQQNEAPQGSMRAPEEPTPETDADAPVIEIGSYPDELIESEKQNAQENSDAQNAQEPLASPISDTNDASATSDDAQENSDAQNAQEPLASPISDTNDASATSDDAQENSDAQNTQEPLASPISPANTGHIGLFALDSSRFATARTMPDLVSPAIAPTSSGAGETKDISADSRSLYRVVRGDCLWRISRREYGRGSLWPVIFAANSNIDDPDLIFVDQMIEIPER